MLVYSIGDVPGILSASVSDPLGGGRKADALDPDFVIEYIPPLEVNHVDIDIDLMLFEENKEFVKSLIAELGFNFEGSMVLIVDRPGSPIWAYEARALRSISFRWDASGCKVSAKLSGVPVSGRDVPELVESYTPPPPSPFTPTNPSLWFVPDLPEFWFTEAEVTITTTGKPVALLEKVLVFKGRASIEFRVSGRANSLDPLWGAGGVLEVRFGLDEYEPIVSCRCVPEARVSTKEFTSELTLSGRAQGTLMLSV